MRDYCDIIVFFHMGCVVLQKAIAMAVVAVLGCLLNNSNRDLYIHSILLPVKISLLSKPVTTLCKISLLLLDV